MPQRPPLSESVSPIQACPRCERLCNYEHVGYADAKPPARYGSVLLYCEQCDRGFEVLWVWMGAGSGYWRRGDTVLEYGPDNRDQLEKFVGRLRDLTAIAA